MGVFGVHVRYTDGRIAFPPAAMMGMYNLAQPPKLSAACERGAHWECTMPDCKCPHHDIRKPDKRKDPKPGRKSKEMMTMAAGKR